MSALFDNPELKVIAEIGGNHNGDLALAKRMVDSAATSGAWAVKFQTYKVEELVAPQSEYFAAFASEGLDFAAFAELADHCRGKGVTFLSTPFGEKSADFLEQLDVPAIKIASGDVTHLEFLRHVAAKGRPVLLSTGASDWSDIDRAVEVLRGENCEFALMHCTASYPANDAEANLRVLPELARRYGGLVGFSDHTLGIDIALGGIALGAVVVEKHFTVDQSLPGGDNDISILPDELQALVERGGRIAMALGSGERALTDGERELQPIMRRSLVAARDLGVDHVIERGDLLVVRPGTGIEPDGLGRVVGHKLKRGIAAGQLLTWDAIGGSA